MSGADPANPRAAVNRGSLDAGRVSAALCPSRFTRSGCPCRFPRSILLPGKAPRARSHGDCARSPPRFSRLFCSRPISASRRSPLPAGSGCGRGFDCLWPPGRRRGSRENHPPLLGAAILLLAPLAFLLSTARNCRQLSDILALALGLALFPFASMLHTGVDILISGVSAGTLAYRGAVGGGRA